MDLQKIYESLGITNLDEDKQKEIKEVLDDIIELKSKEIVDKKMEEARNGLVEEYESKFDTYKDEITSKFSNFLDDIMEKELQIPEKLKEFAKLGERYEPVLEQVKTMLGIDEGSFDAEAKEIMSEAKDEILNLKEKCNTLISEKVELQTDAEEMAAHIYLRKKCDGLTEAKKEKVMRLLEDVKTKADIDRKFKIVVEDFTGQLNEKIMYCNDCDKEVEVNEDSDNATCPDCGGSLTEKKTEKKKTEKKKEVIKEDNIMETWKTMIRENRI